MSNSTSPAVLELRNLVRAYPQAEGELQVLKGANLSIAPGELVALVGPSGAGKSTLLHAAGLLDRPTSGEIVINGLNAEKQNDDVRTQLRRRFIGFVYQFHHLQPEFSAIENICIPQMIAGVSAAAARSRALELLESVGLAARGTHRPGKLSGGEQQRVAIARALANAPKLLIADEPTGNLDPHTGDAVFDILRNLAKTQGLAGLVATHNPDLARRMDRVVRLQDGVLVAA